MKTISQSTNAIIKMDVIDARQETLVLPYQLREYNTVFTFKPLVDTTNIKSTVTSKKHIPKSNGNSGITLDTKHQPLMASLTISTIDDDSNRKLKLALQEIKKLATTYTSNPLKAASNVGHDTKVNSLTNSSSNNDSKIIVDTVTTSVTTSTTNMDTHDHNNSDTTTMNTTTTTIPGIEIMDELPQSLAERYQLSNKKNKVNDKKRKTATGDNDNDNETSAKFEYPSIDIGAISSNNDSNTTTTNNTNSFNKNKKNKTSNSNSNYNPYLFDNNKKKGKSSSSSLSHPFIILTLIFR